jgi:NADPH:quinone reductase-like Zn-dependent oxidoreductase
VDRARLLSERLPAQRRVSQRLFADASDLPQAVLQDLLDAIAAGEATVPIAKIYTMDGIATAHDDMEHDRITGKLVVSTGR